MKIAFVFPGQGSQQVGMGREFYDTSKEAKAIFDESDKIIQGLTDVIFNGPAEKLMSTEFCQPAIYTFSMAALRALEVHPTYEAMKPKFACGLSLGELSAVAAARAFPFHKTLKLVERRSFFMEEATRIKKGAMAAVIGFDKEKLMQICQETGAEVANFNSPDQIVITGEQTRVEKASEMIKGQGAKRVLPLDVSGAFHSSLMQPAVPKFFEELQKIDFVIPDFPILSNVNALPSSDPHDIRENLVNQITSSVQWIDTISYIASQGVEVFLEIGPGTVLKGLIRKINPQLKVFNIQNPADIDKIAEEQVA